MPCNNQAGLSRVARVVMFMFFADDTLLVIGERHTCVASRHESPHNRVDEYLTDEETLTLRVLMARRLGQRR